MNADTIEYGRECFDCLRWYVPIFRDDPCYLCESRGVPAYPNRVRYWAVRNGISLRELQRRSGVSWAALMQISQGRSVPRTATKSRILTVLGFDPSEYIDNVAVFPPIPRRT